MDDIIFAYFTAITFVFAGVFNFIRKYRIVIGGTACEAEVTQLGPKVHSRGLTANQFMFRFNYDGKWLEKPSINITFFRKRHIGKTRTIYYNENHPKYVVARGIVWDIFCGISLVVGLFILYAVISH